MSMNDRGRMIIRNFNNNKHPFFYEEIWICQKIEVDSNCRKSRKNLRKLGILDSMQERSSERGAVLTHTCLWWHIPVSGDTYLSLVTHTCLWWHIHVSGDTYLSLVTHTCLWWHIPVSGDTYLSLVTHNCLWWHIPVSGDTYLSLVTHTCLWWHIPISGDIYLYLVTHTCLWWHIPVSGDTYMSLVTHTCLWWHISVSGDTYLSLVTNDDLAGWRGSSSKAICGTAAASSAAVMGMSLGADSMTGSHGCSIIHVAKALMLWAVCSLLAPGDTCIN